MVSTTLRELRHDAYRKAVLDAAEQVFARDGYESARMQSVAAVAGISVGTVYEVVGGKAPLFEEVIVRHLPAILDAAMRAGARAEYAVQRLVLGMHVYIDFMLEHPDWMQIHLRAHPWGLGPHDESTDSYAAWREGMELHARVLAAGMDEGSVIQANPDLLARSLAGIQQIHLAQWMASSTPRPPAETVREEIVGLFRRAYLTPAGFERSEGLRRDAD